MPWSNPGLLVSTVRIARCGHAVCGSIKLWLVAPWWSGHAAVQPRLMKFTAAGRQILDETLKRLFQDQRLGKEIGRMVSWTAKTLGGTLHQTWLAEKYLNVEVYSWEIHPTKWWIFQQTTLDYDHWRVNCTTFFFVWTTEDLIFFTAWNGAILTSENFDDQKCGFQV